MKSKRSKFYKKIWEEFHKAKLLPGMHIHHIDGNSSNDSPLNLLACTPEEHWKIHYDQGDPVAIRGKFIQGASRFMERNPAFKHGLKSSKNVFKCKCGNRIAVGYSKVCNACKSVGGRNPKARLVVCVETGKKWECIKDAAIDLGLVQSTLRAWLNPKNNHLNKTTLRYA